MRAIFSVCCARAAVTHAAAPLTTEKNCRRLTSIFSWKTMEGMRIAILEWSVEANAGPQQPGRPLAVPGSSFPVPVLIAYGHAHVHSQQSYRAHDTRSASA